MQITSTYKNIFIAATSHWTTGSSVKYIIGLYLEKPLEASNAHTSTRLFCWLFAHFVPQCQWSSPSKFLSKFLRQNKFLSVCQPVVTRSQTGKIDFFLRNLDPRNSRLNRKRVLIPTKNVGLRLEFALFGN